MRLPGFGRSRHSLSAGQAVAEFALVLPVFLLLVLALFDFGRVVYAQNAITQGARAATRLASVSAPQPEAAIRDRARTMAPGFTLADTAITGDGGLFYPDGTAEGSRVVVHITLDVPLVTPIIANILGGSITVEVTSEDLVRS
jgi:Flp pilus assembly protein TadG